MTPQDVQALEAFLNQLTQARVDAKDPQAAAMIAEATARQPDSAYLLVQRAMLLDRALMDAHAQIATLQNQLQAAQGNGARGFMDNDIAWGAHAGRAPTQPLYPAQAQPQPQAQPYAAAQSSAQYPGQYPAQTPQPAPQAARPGFLSGGLGGTLGSIATTAAGVAGGAMLFQGIENLFHRGGGGFFGGQPAVGAAPGETIVNNYYGDDNFGGGSHRDNALLADNGNLDNGLDDYIDDSQNDDSSFF